MGVAREMWARWGVAGAVLTVTLVVAWIATPVPTSDTRTDTVAHAGLLVMLTFPLGAAVAVASAYFGSTKPSLAVASWVATVILIAWLSFLAAVTAFWSGDLACGPGNPCETGVTHRIAVCLVAEALVAVCLVIERSLRARWARR